jgi:hypothetical protein
MQRAKKRNKVRLFYQVKIKKINEMEFLCSTNS